MASFRPLGQFVQFFLNDGTVNAGGSVTFYETDLTTLKNTYSDPALSVLNSNPVTLDAAGRPSADIWGSGVYGAVLKDRLGTTIQTLNNIQSGTDPGSTIPTLVTSDFLTNDGSNLLWQPIIQVPDPTGSSGDILGTDGTLVFWQTLAAAGIPTITSDVTNGIIIGPNRIQWDTAILPNSGLSTTTVNVTFPTAFSAPPKWIGVTQTDGPGVAGGGKMLILAAASASTTGFTLVADINADSGDPPISRATNVTWMAIGPV